MQVGALTRNAAGGVVERVRHARVVVIIVLVGQVRDIARVDNDVERDLLDGLARQILAHILKTLHTIGKQRLGAGVGECRAKTGGVLQLPALVAYSTSGCLDRASPTPAQKYSAGASAMILGLMKMCAGRLGYEYPSSEPSSLYTTAMAVAAEQLEQIVGTVKTIFLSSMAAVLTVSSARRRRRR